MCFRRNERRQKCPSAPSNATVGADGDVAIVFFFLSVFSQAYLCPRHSTNQDGAEEERSCPCPRGGHDERKFAAEGSGTGGLSSSYSSFRRRGGSYLRGRKYLSALFFRIPFCCLFLLFSRFVPTTATIAFFFFFLASRSRALAYIFEKGSSLAMPVAFYIAADDKGERSVNRTLNGTLKPKRNPSLYFYLFIFKKMFLVGSGGGGERNRQTENSKAQKSSSSSRSPLPALGHTLRGSAPRRP